MRGRPGLLLRFSIPRLVRDLAATGNPFNAFQAVALYRGYQLCLAGGSDQLELDMKDTVFLADIEYAQKLLNAGCDHNAIVAALCYRGLSEPKAEQLLLDIGQGRKVEVALPRVPRSKRSAPRPRPAATPKRRRQWLSWKAFFILYMIASAIFFIVHFFVRVQGPPSTQESPPMRADPPAVHHAPSWRD